MAGGNEKNQIDRLRDGAGMISIDEGEGEITGFVNIGEDFFVLKTTSMHQILMADRIDPERKNINIPNSHRKILSAGTDSEILSRTLLTADALFPKNRLVPDVDRKDILELILMDISKNLLAAEEISYALDIAQMEATIPAKPAKGGGLKLPSIPILEDRINSYIQKIEHVMQAIRRLYRMFYASEIATAKGKDFDAIANAIAAKYGAQDKFSEFSKEVTGYYKLIRNIRHCIEHRKSNQRLELSDFTLSPEGNIIAPTISVIHDETPVGPHSVSSFMHEIMTNHIYIAETLIVFLAQRNVPPIPKFPIQIAFIPPEARSKGSKVQYGYALIEKHKAWPVQT